MNDLAGFEDIVSAHADSLKGQNDDWDKNEINERAYRSVRKSRKLMKTPKYGLFDSYDRDDENYDD